jgi:hypothetical protein
VDKIWRVVHSKNVDNVDNLEFEQRFCANCQVDHKNIIMSLAYFGDFREFYVGKTMVWPFVF